MPEDYQEMHAIKLDAPDDPPMIARNLDGSDEAAVLKCAKLLAEMVTPVE
jgi:hypothetical protein